MATDLLSSSETVRGRTARKLLLIWRNPENRRLVRVGELDVLIDGHFAFRYLPGATDPAFSPLVQFPDQDKTYVSNSLPAFFRNRVMSRARPSYSDYRRWIGLEQSGSDTPVEVLLRTGGSRATDTFHIVDDIDQAADGIVVSRFLASGIRHISGARDRLATLQAGQLLALRDEPDNQSNPRAVLIDVSAGAPVGYVPDWLVDDLHDLRSRADELVVIAERVNPDAPSRLQLLCRIEAKVTRAGQSTLAIHARP